MSSKRLSPAASLLRSSRLFSLPPPLPKPSVATVSPGLPFHLSETATLSHPTHAAIATPASSLARGDWGLKRPLPLRSTTHTSTPTIRVEQVDSIDHVTDFASAADHTQTLRKWQEMNIPLTVPESQRRAASMMNAGDYVPQRSVFEQELDDTHQDDHTGPQVAQRWKYQGPWLAGQTSGEFQQYVTKEIRRRKHEFRTFVRERLMARNETEQRRIAIEDGRPPLTPDELSDGTGIPEEELQAHITSLRHDTSALSDLIHAFLDLPPSTIQSALDIDDLFSQSIQVRKPTTIYGETGPPKTHPSAGLSYLRTAAHVPNHPILGPQASRAPVEARVLVPRIVQGSGYAQPSIAKLGVGGVVAEDHTPSTMRNHVNGASHISKLNPETVGGGKAWVHPMRANINAKGCIELHIVPAKRSTIGLHQGELPETEPAYGASQASTRSSDDDSPALGMQGSGHGYGLEGLGSQKVRPDQEDAWSENEQEGLGRTYKELEDLLTQKRRTSDED